MAALEIRTYRLRPGTTPSFHRAMIELSVPLLKAAGIDVVRCGPSEQNEDAASHYVLVRAFADLATREELEMQFYSSTAWQNGPRGAVIDAIESYHTVVFTVDKEAVDALRQAHPAGSTTSTAAPIRGRRSAYGRFRDRAY